MRIHTQLNTFTYVYIILVQNMLGNIHTCTPRKWFRYLFVLLLANDWHIVFHIKFISEIWTTHSYTFLSKIYNKCINAHTPHSILPISHTYTWTNLLTVKTETLKNNSDILCTLACKCNKIMFNYDRILYNEGYDYTSYYSLLCEFLVKLSYRDAIIKFCYWL